MNNKKNNFNFDIPIPVILIALIFSFPIGVILAVLRAVSTPTGKKTVENAGRKAEEAFDDIFSKVTADEKKKPPTAETVHTPRPEGKKKKKKHKTPASVVLLWIACILFFVIGLFGVMGALADFTTAGLFLRDLMQYPAPFMTLSGICYLLTLFFKGKNGEYNRIRAIIGDRDSVSLRKIAAASGKKVKKIRRDLQHLINKGEFGESAYIDLGTGCFMRHPDAVPDVTPAGDSRPLHDSEIFGKGDSVSEEEKTEEAAADKDSFRSIILEIRRLNDEIRDFAVSEKIYRMEEHTQNIFDYVTAHPEAMPQIRTFMNYYLPTTLKLLESYARIERMGAAGENMQKSKEKIESILDLLVSGYEQQVDLLFRDEAIDISSDVSVLETMMQMNGLGGKGDIRSPNAPKPKETDLGGTAAQSMPEAE